MKKTFLALSASLLLLFAQAQTGDNTIKQRTISVNGSAQKEITPDEIYVQVELREYNKKNGDKIDIQTINNQFLTAAKGMNLADSDVVVQSYSGWDGNNWWYQKNKKKNPDMKAGITYEVKLKSVDDMNKFVVKLDDEATQNFYISRTSHSKIDSIKNELKVQALKNAKAEAVYLAAALDEKVGKPLTINDPNEGNNYPRPMYKTSMMAADVAAAPPVMDVDFKKMKIQYDVNVVFELQ